MGSTNSWYLFIRYNMEATEDTEVLPTWVKIECFGQPLDKDEKVHRVRTKKDCRL